MKKIRWLALALAAIAAVFTAGAYGSFQKPPSAALKSLRATVGKPFKSGWVFVDGKYIEPPYKVERWGTALRINGVQITPEIVPWNEFLKTQDGVTMTKNEPSGDDLFGEEEVEEEVDEEEEEDLELGDEELSLDDLFDDDPAPKKETSKKKSTRRAKPRKPAATVTYSFDGEFTPNDRTKSYVKKINAERTRIDKLLRAGGYIFCGSRYAMLTGDSGSAKLLIKKLPDLMRKNADASAFARAVQAERLTYLPPALVEDLHHNRFSYPQLQKRLKDDAEAKQWSGLKGTGL